jgi:tetratricopeptide (TPR) repeat protein
MTGAYMNKKTQDFFDVDISDWDQISPYQLLTNPYLLQNKSIAEAASRALKYARVGATDNYDEIGFRSSVVIPTKGQFPLQTVASMRLERESDERRKINPESEAILEEYEKLRHRPLDLPDGNFKYVLRTDRIDYYDTKDNIWSFSKRAPPSVLLTRGLEDRDLPKIVTQTYSVNIPGCLWIPLTVLIKNGHFKRMQDWKHELIDKTAPGCFYYFVSHRWLSTGHPDPTGAQSRFIAWQIFSHLCEAVRVANMRGLDMPRKFSTLVGFAVGAYGSDLAESLLVNVLRHTLDSGSIIEATQEVTTIESNIILDYGVAAANDEASLRRLQEILISRPVLSHLMSRIFLWYDYSCMPQPPRSESEENLFSQGLQYLKSIQLLGRSLILLDDVEDYLSRAWCTLEALTADPFQSIDMMVGSKRPTAREGLVEHFFDNLLQDRPHIVWRGLLDTEVFGHHDPEECMRRLGLEVTDERDMPHIYRSLYDLRAPRRIHVDESELVTGVFPLPTVNNGTSVLWNKDLGGSIYIDDEQNRRKSLDWTNAINLKISWNLKGGDDADRVPPFQQYEPKTRSPVKYENRPHCHIAVIASCEGEAVILSNWVSGHRSELEELIDTPIASLSWIASDIAPVGHFVYGKLKALAIDADVIVVMTLSARFVHCNLTRLLIDLMQHAGRRTIAFSVDLTTDNVLMLASAIKQTSNNCESQQLNMINIPEAGFPVYRGGLFRSAVKQYLVQNIPEGDEESLRERDMMMTRVMMKARSHYDQGEFQQAVESYDQVLKKYPNDVEALTNKGLSLAQMQKYNEALELYDKALRIDSHSEIIWFNKGQALSGLERYGEAVVCYDKAIEINPNYVSGWDCKGNALHDLGKYDEAIVCYDKATEINPNDLLAWNNKGRAFYDLGKYDKAIVCYDKATEIDDGIPGIWENKYFAFNKLGKREDAERSYNKARQLESK